MNLFYGDIETTQATLNADETLHCTKVLRYSVGDIIWVTNGKGKTIEGTIISITKKSTVVSITKDIQIPSTQTGLHLAVCPTKSIDRFEFIIEKAVELGVSEFTPVFSDHSERKKLNLTKLHKKVIMACKQSLQSTFMQLHTPQKIDDFIVAYPQSSIYLSHCNTEYSRIPITELPTLQNSIVLIGPEGDFSSQEIETFTKLPNCQSISLGSNRLRTETAAVFTAGYFYSKMII